MERRSTSRLSDRIESFLNDVSVREKELMNRQMNQLRRFGTSRKSLSVASINSKLMGRTSSSNTLKAPSQSQKSLSNFSQSSSRQFSGIGKHSASLTSFNVQGITIV